MTVKEFIKQLSERTEEHISIAFCSEDAETSETDGPTFTPTLEAINGRLYIIAGPQETG